MLVSDGASIYAYRCDVKFEMLCLGDCGDVDDEDYETIEFENDDELDFSMFNRLLV